MDGDGHQLRGAVGRGDREAVGQRPPTLQRLHRRVAVVERIGPGATRGQRVGAVTVGGRRARRYRYECVGGIVDIGRFSVPVAVGVPAVPLLTPPASVTEPLLAPVITAASLRRWMVTVTSCAVPSAVVTVKLSRQRLADVERLHGRIAVVERVGPVPRRVSVLKVP